MSERWLVTKARKLHVDLYPNSKLPFKASHGWRIRFARRQGIVPRVKTNNKTESIEKRLPRIQRWHQGFRRMLQSEKERAQFGAKYGLFPPRLRYNMDSVPLPFINEQKSTFAMQGEKRVWIAQPGNGAYEKRFCTLHLAFSPDAKQQPKPALIFRGQGLRISSAEKAAYDSRVDVYWQPKAWADTKFTVAYVERTLAPSIDFQNDEEEALLLADNLNSQVADEFKSKCKSLRIQNWEYPANTTELLQPTDAGLGRDFKREIGLEMAKWLEDDANLEQWEDNKITVSDRRVLLTQWVCETVCRCLSSTIVVLL